MKHRDAIKKTRPGPGQDAAKRRALSVRFSCPSHMQACPACFQWLAGLPIALH